MNKILTITKYFIDNPLFFISYFFSIIPFWVILFCYFKADFNYKIIIMLFPLALFGKCIINSELKGENPFLVLLNTIYRGSILITTNFLIFIWIAFLSILMIFTSDFIIRLIALCLIIMSFVFFFAFKSKYKYNNIWELKGLKNNRLFFIGIAATISWLIFIEIDGITYKALSLILIIILEIIRFTKQYECIF
jgi:hypothetical protein